MNAVSGLIQF